MTTLNGYIEGLGSGADRIVRKTGKEVKLSVFDNIDNVIVFNQEGETSQETNDGRNLLNPDPSDLNVTATPKGIEVSSTSYEYYSVRLFNSTLPVGSYVLKDFKGGSSTTHQLVLYKNGSTLAYITTGQRAFTVDNTSDVWGVRLYVYRNNTDPIIQPQLEAGSQPTSYEPYCGGVPSPNPSYPQDIKGIGIKQLDGTYKVLVDYYDEREERSGRITASGLAYPLYEGDILDFVNGKVIRANGYKVLDGSENWQAGIGDFELTISDMLSGSYLDGKSDRFKVISAGSLDDNTIKLGDNNQKLYILTNISGVTDVATWKTWLSNNNTTIVYPLATPTDEYITLSGDISDIGTATVEADGTLTVKYDKVEMAIRKYSSPPDWSKIGYSETPSFILDGFNYSKQIYDSWTSAASYASKFRGDKALKFFPEVDLTGATNYSAMFQESGILSTPPLTIGDGSNTVINSQLMFQSSPIEKIELTTSEATQKVQIANIFNGCTMLKNAKLTLSASGSMQYAFADCNRLERIEDGLETSDVTSFSEAFRACSSLLYLYELDLSSCTTCYRAFYNCTSLYSAPYLNNIRTGGNFQQMFWNCSSLRILPLYNLGSPSNLENMFQGTGSNLEEASRINILIMLAACTYSGTKTLAHLGFTASMYSAASWQALPHYNDFVSAGWSIGYN